MIYVCNSLLSFYWNWIKCELYWILLTKKKINELNLLSKLSRPEIISVIFNLAIVLKCLKLLFDSFIACYIATPTVGQNVSESWRTLNSAPCDRATLGV